MKEKGYRINEYGCPVKRYCQTLSLKKIRNLLQNIAIFIVGKKLGLKLDKEFAP
jgi:hypothetical protein